jgi:hypothetical protein
MPVAVYVGKGATGLNENYAVRRRVIPISVRSEGVGRKEPGGSGRAQPADQDQREDGENRANFVLQRCQVRKFGGPFFEVLFHHDEETLTQVDIRWALSGERYLNVCF